MPSLNQSAFKAFTQGHLAFAVPRDKGRTEGDIFSGAHEFISAEPLTWNAYSTKRVRFAALLCNKCLKTRAVLEARHKNRAGYAVTKKKKKSFWGKKDFLYHLYGEGKEGEGREEQHTKELCMRVCRGG